MQIALEYSLPDCFPEGAFKVFVVSPAFFTLWTLQSAFQFCPCDDTGQCFEAFHLSQFNTAVKAAGGGFVALESVFPEAGMAVAESFASPALVAFLGLLVT